jgi:hypothetical protein
MIPHRIKLALVVAAACVSLSCLDARVRVPVKVAPWDDANNVKLMPQLTLVVRRADPFVFKVCDSEVGGCEECSGGKNCWKEHVDPARANVPACEARNDKEGRSNFVARETTSLDGTASFDLLPGDYEICSEVPTPFGDKQVVWGVPFRVEGDDWKMAHRDSLTREWVYPNDTESVSEPQLVLSNDNEFWFKPGATATQAANQTATQAATQPTASNRAAAGPRRQ